MVGPIASKPSHSHSKADEWIKYGTLPWGWCLIDKYPVFPYFCYSQNPEANKSSVWYEVLFFFSNQEAMHCSWKLRFEMHSFLWVVWVELMTETLDPWPCRILHSSWPLNFSNAPQQTSFRKAFTQLQVYRTAVVWPGCWSELRQQLHHICPSLQLKETQLTPANFPKSFLPLSCWDAEMLVYLSSHVWLGLRRDSLVHLSSLSN